MKKLKETKSLARSDEGFLEIESLLLSNKWPAFLAFNRSLTNRVCVASVEKLWVKTELGMSEDSILSQAACFHLGLKVQNGKTFDVIPIEQDEGEKCMKVELKELMSQVDDLKTSSVLVSPFLIFILGAAIETWAFALENRKEHGCESKVSSFPNAVEEASPERPLG